MKQINKEITNNQKTNIDLNMITNFIFQYKIEFKYKRNDSYG